MVLTVFQQSHVDLCLSVVCNSTGGHKDGPPPLDHNCVFVLAADIIIFFSFSLLFLKSLGLGIEIMRVALLCVLSTKLYSWPEHTHI